MIKLSDVVIYRNPTELGTCIRAKVTGINLASATPYTVTALNRPYKGTEYKSSADSLTPSTKLFGKAMIVDRGSSAYFTMFRELANGCIQNSPDSLFRGCDLVVFTGGEDISPFIYGEKPHKSTFFNPERDRQEALIYLQAKKLNIPCVGICRGAQFLNVMNGGRMVQHISGHTESHDIITSCGHKFEVTSTHHQMMDPHDSADILAWSEQRSDKYEGLVDFEPCVSENKTVEPEVLVYRESGDLCVQYHPETMQEHSPARTYFAEILKELR